MQSMNKSTLVVGASSNPERYSYKAIHLLVQKGIDVYAQGLREESVAGVPVYKDFSQVPSEIDTITLYLNPQRQTEIIPTLLALHPRRIIFNPGTENDALRIVAESQGIETLEACTLVLLSTGAY
jgi:predicted CoA-binding protein